MNKTSIRTMLALLVGGVMLLASCGGDDDAATTVTAAPGEGPVANACPADGCVITITSVTGSGDELEVTWDANFLPDVSKNHIHIYWDTFAAEEVSSDAEANGFTQGDWSPTADYPVYVTESGSSVANRGDSVTLCVTAADRDHAVIDPSLVHCRDVSDQL